MDVWIAFGTGMFLGAVVAIIALGLLAILYEKYNDRKKNNGGRTEN